MLRYALNRALYRLFNLLAVFFLIFALLSLIPNYSILILG